MTKPTQAQSEPIPETQELPFEAEVKQILHLMVHSLYTNREVFVRELIANASDALDKVRFLALTDATLAERTGQPEITITLDKSARTLSIEDNGIGMTRAEAIHNLGTIAHSGTIEFLKRVKEAKGEEGARLIGQFGVGFYAAFTVSDRVDVESRSATDPGAEPILWRSAGQGSFIVTKSDRQRPGTKVTVHINKEHDELLEEWHIRGLIKKYSDFVSYPIKLGEQTVNQTSALWTRPRGEITDEQYEEFFKHAQGGFEAGKPLARMHFSSDAPIQYHALLFIPDKAPFDLMMDTRKKGIRLYAKRMFVMDGCEKLAPPYLQFLRGVVDSEDLSLNVSRETLQDDKTLEIIQKAVVKQALKTLQDMAEHQPDQYLAFWTEFGRLLRLGINSDAPHRELLAKLLRYPSSRSEGDELTSLQAYVDRMPEGQKAIYYLTGPSISSLRNSPHLEVFRRRGVEVLLMADPVDEWVVASLATFGGKPIESVAHGTIDLEDLPPEPASESDDTRAEAEGLDALMQVVKRVLQDRVKDVRASKRLTESAAVLVSDEGDASPQLERVLRMLERDVPTPKRILELNAKHPFVHNLALLCSSEGESERVRTFAELLLDQAMIAEGVVPDPTGLVKRMQQVLTAASEVATTRGSS